MFKTRLITMPFVFLFAYTLGNIAATIPAHAEVQILHATAINVPQESVAGFLEGPCYGDGHLYYTQRFHKTPDRKPVIRQLDVAAPEKGAIEFANYPSGGTWYHQGKITALAGLEKTSGVIRFTLKDGKAEGKPKILFQDGLPGRPFVGINDIARDAHGGFYFTDKKGKAVFYLSKDNQCSVVAAYEDDGDKANDRLDELDNPNGIIVSKDSNTLYVTDNTNILYAPIASPGVLAGKLKHLLPGTGVTEKTYHKIAGIKQSTDKKGRTRFEAKYGSNLRLDGMTIDKDGVIYAAGLSSGIVYGWDGQTGKLIRIVKCPSGATNCTFGGQDGRTLYVVGGGMISSVTMK